MKHRKHYFFFVQDEDQPMIINRPKVKTGHEQDVERMIILVPEICKLTGLTQVRPYVFNSQILSFTIKG
jgi:phosphoglycerol transferase MdoB-like AlkP superfamily enzyme